jgi:hypothetical protein
MRSVTKMDSSHCQYITDIEETSVLCSVDDVDVFCMPAEHVQCLIMGPEGTSVRLGLSLQVFVLYMLLSFGTWYCIESTSLRGWKCYSSFRAIQDSQGLITVNLVRQYSIHRSPVYSVHHPQSTNITSTVSTRSDSSSKKARAKDTADYNERICPNAAALRDVTNLDGLRRGVNFNRNGTGLSCMRPQTQGIISHFHTHTSPCVRRKFTRALSGLVTFRCLCAGPPGSETPEVSGRILQTYWYIEMLTVHTIMICIKPRNLCACFCAHVRV